MARKLLSPGIRLSLILLLTTVPRAALAADGAAPASAQPTLLQVTVNGQPMAEPVLLLRGEDGALYATSAMLTAWRLQVPAIEPVLFENEPYFRITGIEGLEARYSDAEQALTLTAAASLFDQQRAELDRAELLPMTPASTGGFVNYDIFAEYYAGQASINGAAEFGIFTRHGVGTSSFIGHAGSEETRVTRLETSWTIDRPGSLSSLRLGDAVSVAGPGSHPVRFAGVQYSRNFAVQPGFITMPLPVLEGSAALPSVVDVYVNNALQGSQTLNPGPFELANIPVPTGSGTVQLVMRDMLGRTVVAEQSYYANAGLLRRGLHDFSYEVGFLRNGFGSRSNDYGDLIGSTAHRYGISDSVTAEAHLQASSSTQLAGAGLLVALRGVGVLGGSGAASRSGRGTGAHATASFERRDSSFSFGLRGQYASAGYAFLGMPEHYVPARLDIQAFADAPLGGAGAIGMNLVHRDNRDRRDETLAGVFSSFRVGRAAAVQLFARRSIAGASQTTVGGHVSFLFGGSRSAAVSAEYRAGGSAAYLSAQQNAPAGVGSGWRVAASSADAFGVDAEFVHNSRFATHRAELTHFGGRTGARLSTAGAVAMVGDRAFASRRLGQSFAVVDVGRHENVRVYADNQLIGRTDAGGRLVIPAMRAFDRNIIRIDETDLPMDVQVGATELAVRPFARAGSLISFPVRRERGILLQIALDDGGLLPAGALVQVNGEPARHVAASGGEVYLPSAEGRLRLTVTWAGQSCSLTADVSDNDDPQPRLGGLVCRREASYAAR